MYQWLFRKNGYNVSNTGYLLYYNGLKNQPMFNQELKFEKHLISLEYDDSWVEDKIIEAVNTLKEDEMPNGSKSCDTCQYLKKDGKLVRTFQLLKLKSLYKNFQILQCNHSNGNL